MINAVAVNRDSCKTRKLNSKGKIEKLGEIADGEGFCAKLGTFFL